jgi:hypothetical protein
MGSRGGRQLVSPRRSRSCRSERFRWPMPSALSHPAPALAIAAYFGRGRLSRSAIVGASCARFFQMSTSSASVSRSRWDVRASRSDSLAPFRPRRCCRCRDPRALARSTAACRRSVLLPLPRYGVPRCVRRADERRSRCRVLRSLLIGSVLFRIPSDRGLASQCRGIPVGTRLDRRQKRIALGVVALGSVRRVGPCPPPDSSWRMPSLPFGFALTVDFRPRFSRSIETDETAKGEPQPMRGFIPRSYSYIAAGRKFCASAVGS